MIGLLIDICVGIFLLFNILYAVRFKTFDYLQTFVYLLSFVFLYLLSPGLYRAVLTKWPLPERFQGALGGNIHILIYFGLELILFIFFTLVLKVLSHFTLQKIVDKKQGLIPLGQRFVNIPFALVFGFIWSFILVFVLARLGVPYQGTLSQVVFEKSAVISEVGTLNKHSQRYSVYNSVKLLETFLSGEEVPELREGADTISADMYAAFTALKNDLPTAALEKISGDDLDSILLLTGQTESENLTFLEIQADDVNLHKIKRSLQNLQAYHGFARGLSDPANNSAYRLFIFLSEHELDSNNKTLNKKLNTLKDQAKLVNTLMVFTSNFLDIPVWADSGSYKHYVNELLYKEDYLLLLRGYIQEYGHLTPEIRQQYLDSFIGYGLFEESDLTLCEQYFKNELFLDIFESVKSGKAGLFLPIIDDVVEDPSDLALICKLIIAEYPELSREQLKSLINLKFKITSHAKTKLIKALEEHINI